MRWNMKTNPGALGILFSPDTHQKTAQVYLTLSWLVCGPLHRCLLAWMRCILTAVVFGRACPYCGSVRVCVLISVPPCFASVQKGLVPTTWCRTASSQPIPAWIATLAANQKLPAAFAVCPLSIFSNTSLSLLASLGCCINPPPPLSARVHIITFLW